MLVLRKGQLGLQCGKGHGVRSASTILLVPMVEELERID